MYDQIHIIIKSSGGIAKTSDFVAAGISKNALKELTDKGELIRVRHGYYQLADDTGIPEAQYIASLLPEGIVCVESALYYYGYSDYAPREWTIAVPRSIALTKLRLDVVPIKAYYVQKDVFDIGKTTARFDGVTLSIYDRERTICDCFRYRTKTQHIVFFFLFVSVYGMEPESVSCVAW